MVLYQLGEYEACLSDTRSALLFGYPAHLQYKLHEREGRCNQALGRIGKARENCNSALNNLALAKVSFTLTGQTPLIIQHMRFPTGQSCPTNFDVAIFSIASLNLYLDR